jgi:hypothetical protein
MAFENENLIQISAGEGSPDQLAGQRIYSYESTTDPLADIYGGMLAPGYFDSLANKVRIGSYFILTYSAISQVYKVISANPEADVVFLALAIAQPPSPSYSTMAEGPLTFITGGAQSDVVPYAASEVGMFANFSLNSPVNDVGPPVAHSGIEHVECQAGQIEIFWSRIVTIGQTVNMWLQLKSATPS